MAFVVFLTTIVTEESHRVTLGDMFGVILHELLYTVPESRDSLLVFVQTKHEAILLLVLGHETERIVMNVAEKFDAGLDSPVPFVVQHEWLTEEETRFEATHVSVTNGIAIDNLALRHIFTNLPRLILVDVIGERPMLMRNLAIVSLARHEGARNFFESRIEWLVIEENPIVIVAAVEAIFDLTDRTSNVPHIAVAGKRDEGGVHTRARGSS